MVGCSQHVNGQHARVVTVANGNHTDAVFVCELHCPVGGDLADHHPVTIVSIEKCGCAEPTDGFDTRSWIDDTGCERAHIGRHSHHAM